ncbi:MAG: hypothetical protein ACFCUE_05375 [Candidatus Bathyarchaeia archaeon]|jgi:hypothetical protein
MNSKTLLNEKYQLKRTKLTIMCKCGEEILIVPDLNLMKKAIETHLEKCTLCDEEYLAEEIIKVLSNALKG